MWNFFIYANFDQFTIVSRLFVIRLKLFKIIQLKSQFGSFVVIQLDLD